MPRFMVTRGKNGMAQTMGCVPPEERKFPKKPKARKTIDEALSDKPTAKDDVGDREEVGTRRRRIVREGGEIRIEGGPGPGEAAGFGDVIDDPLGGGEDADETADIDEATAALTAAGVTPDTEGEEDTAPEPDRFPCPEDGCEFVAVSSQGLSSHVRAKHGGSSE